ncbi:SWIM zinc finger domain-containing protein [Phormidium tenue FACHB-886]|nr:SWIM zinc finger domain-containing protein [Phormidium tenue FACHB-886]
MSISISEATIRRYANDKSFQRGEAYFQAGAVSSLTRRGNQLQGEVEGNQADSYRVTFQFDQGEVTSTHCTCPYDFDGWCKHLVAAALVCTHQPQQIEERPSLNQLLDRLNLIQTQRLVQSLVEEHPQLIDAIDRLTQGLTTPPAKAAPQQKSPRRTAIDPAPFRRQVQRLLYDARRELEDVYLEEDPVTDALLEIVQQAQNFSQQGDGYSALVILEAIATTCISNWNDLEDYGISTEPLTEELDAAFTDAILNADLTAEEKVDWQINLETWQDELNGNFSMSLAALQQGWEHPKLQQILGGKIPELGAWEGTPPDFADELAQIRLQVLERQERYSEYLYLAEAEGQHHLYLTMLTRLGRIDEAMALVHSQLDSLESAFALAQTLRQQGAIDQALEVAQLGLALPGHSQHQLALWTSDLAEGLGNRSLALTARIAAFKANPSLADYCKAAELADEDSSTVKADLLQNLRQQSGWQMIPAKVDVFLHEGYVADAIAAVSELHYPQPHLIQHVMAAAIVTHPDWVIQQARYHAEAIMDSSKSARYHEAIGWLKYARAAHLETGQRLQWLAYRDRLLLDHGRKYKLVALLKGQELE